MPRHHLTLPVALATSVLATLSITSSGHAQSLAGLHAKVQVGGKTCFASHRHDGFGRTNGSKRATVQAAVRKWTSYTALEYGKAWANFRQANDRQMSCSKRTSGWACTVSALPCRR